MMPITIHMVIRNEPFVYYAVKSVYDEADIILLYDTGSNDEHTINDISRILDEDDAGKIIFKSVPIETDETKWAQTTVREMAESCKGKFQVGSVRQMQIDETETDYFMLVDGDEVHYRGVVTKIKEEALPLLDNGFSWARIPYMHFCDTDKIFGPKRAMGRVFKTKDICMKIDFPEMHVVKGETISGSKKYCMNKYNIKAFAHFSTYVKPWRQPYDLPNVRPADRPLPEVMIENTYFMDRYKEYLNKCQI